MSSIIRRISQIPVRTKYLLVVQTDTASANPSDSPAFVLDSTASWPATVGTVAIPESVVNDNAVARGVAEGSLYRDLGRQIIIADESGMHLAHYRAALLMSNAAAEGVGAFTEVYLRVWAADGDNVRVARTG